MSAAISFGDADPTLINCLCAVAGATDTLTCRNPGAGDVIVATVTPCTGTFTLNSFLLDNQNYQLRVDVYDEDGTPAVPCSASGPTSVGCGFRTVDVAMANVAPTPSMAISNADLDDAGGTTPLLLTGTVSTVAGTPTTVLEGFDYLFTYSFTDPGTDTLNWTWNLAGRDSGGVAGLPTPGNHMGRMAFSRTPTTGTSLVAGTAGAAALTLNTQRTVSFNQGAGTLSLIATDDDAATTNSQHFINVVDVNPTVTSLTADATNVAEGSPVVFTVSGLSGDFGSGQDVLRANGYVWEIEVDGAFVATNSPALTNRVAITAGCDANGTIADGGRTGTDTCTLTFLDADSTFTNQYRVRATVSDEDSTAQQISSAVTVTNRVPAITKLNVARGATTLGTLASPAATINEADTITVTVGFEDEGAAFDGAYTLAINYGQTTPTTDNATLATPGDFAAQTETFADNKVCTSGVCTITVTVCEAAPPVICDTETLILA